MPGCSCLDCQTPFRHTKVKEGKANGLSAELAPLYINLFGLNSSALSRGRAGPGELPVPALPGGLLVAKVGHGLQPERITLQRLEGSDQHGLPQPGLGSSTAEVHHMEVGLLQQAAEGPAAPDLDLTAVPKAGEVGVELASES